MNPLIQNILIVALVSGIAGFDSRALPASGGTAARRTAPLAQHEPSSVALEPPQHPQLDDFRRSILDPTSEYGTRVTVGTLLVRVGTEEALRVVATLLGSVEPADVPKAMCEAITRAGSENPALLALPGSSELVDRLAILIGAEDADLRTRAAAALAVMPRALMITRLIKSASDVDTPEARRLAALDALSRHIHNRQVAGVMISLLDDRSSAVAQRALSALPPVVRSPAPTTRQAWKDWWKTKEGLTSEEWLQERVDLLSNRVHSLENQRSELQATLERQAGTLAGRIADLQRDVYFAIPEKDRDAKLLTWLADTTSAVCAGAMQLVLRRIGESGGAPPDAVRAAVRKQIDHPSAEVRRRVLQIVAAIKDPEDAQDVIDRLEKETDPTVRQAALAVFGQLKNTKAVFTLVAEISNPTASSECILAAARSLAEITSGENVLSDEQRAACVEALKHRAAQPSDNGNGAAYAAVIEAMAAIAAPEFETDFIAAVDRTDPLALRSAIRGLARLKNRAKLPQVRTLATSPDPGVRQAACEALGAIGHEDADLETLLSRLRPNVEPQASVRDAAWAATRALIDARPPEQQLRWIDRLSDLPVLQAAYLAGLLAPARMAQTDPVFVLSLRERLGVALAAQGRWAESMDALQAVYDALCGADEPRAFEVGLRVLEAKIRSATHERLAAFIESLLKHDGADIERIIAVIQACLKSPELVSPKALDALETELRRVPAEPLPESWRRLLSTFDAPDTAGDTDATPYFPLD